MCLLRNPVYNTSLGLPLIMLSVVESLLILNENIFFDSSVSILFSLFIASILFVLGSN